MSSVSSVAGSSLSYREVRRRLSPRAGLGVQLVAFVGLVGLAAAGFFLAPGASPPIDVGTHSRWGGWTLEAAFTYAAFQAAIISFRVMELLFRDPLSELVRSFPVPTVDIVWERFTVIMRESLLFFLPAFAFIGGIYAAEPSIPIALTLTYLVAATIINGAVAYGSTLLLVSSSAGAGQWLALSSNPEKTNKAAFIASAPAVALALVGITDLFLKLGWEELYSQFYRDGSFALSRAATVVLSTILILVAATFVGGMKQASGSYRRFLAEFDRSMFQAPGEEDWVSNESLPRSRWTRSIGARAGLLIDRKRTEFQRVHPFLLFGNYIAAFLFFVAGVVWRDNSALQFLSPALSAFWVAGAIRIPERLRRLAAAAVVLDHTLVPRRTNESTTAYAAWLLGTQCMAPLVVAGVAASALFADMSGIAIACIVTLLVEQWVVLRNRFGGSTLAARTLAVTVGIGAAFAAISVQTSIANGWLVALGIGIVSFVGWWWLGYLLKTGSDKFDPSPDRAAKSQ